MKLQPFCCPNTQALLFLAAEASIVCLCPVLQPRVASTEAIATWNELSRCPYIKEAKTIVHPGEVRCCCCLQDALLLAETSGRQEMAAVQLPSIKLYPCLPFVCQ
jgi:hypothetical protein